MVRNTRPLFAGGNVRPKLVVVLAAVFFVIAAALTKHHAYSWNDDSRMATIDALAAHHTFAIDGERAYPTGDKYRYAGRFYSDKPPALALGGAAVAVVLDRAGVTLARKPSLGYYLITLLLVGAAYALGLAALYETARIFSAGPLWAACVTVAAGAATLLLPYATILNNHVVGGSLAVIALRIFVDPRLSRRTVALGAGLFALASSIDISFAIFLALAPLLLVRFGLRRAVGPFCAAVIPIGAAYFAFNLALSGSLVPPALHLALWTYPGSAFNANNLTGLALHRSLREHASYAADLLVGNHGLFAYMPVLVMSLYAAVYGWRRFPARRPVLLFIVAGCALYVASYAWSSSDYSGFAFGIRWWAGIVYLAMIPFAFIEDAVARSMPVRWAFIAATVASAVVAVVGLADPATPNDVGIAPFVFNLHELLAGHHPAKLASSAAFVLATAAVVIRLATLVARSGDGRSAAGTCVGNAGPVRG